MDQFDLSYVILQKKVATIDSFFTKSKAPTKSGKNAQIKIKVFFSDSVLNIEN